jgi:hypothetical protein
MSRNDKIQEFMKLVDYVHRGEPDYPSSMEFVAIVDMLFSEILRHSVDMKTVRRLVADFFRRNES